MDIFVSINSPPPTDVLPSRADHPLECVGIVNPDNKPIPTNKFYANFFLGSQYQATWTHPYSLSWCKGSGNARSWGLGISHIDADQRAYGPDPHANPVQYYINPIGIQSIILSASELDSSTTISIDEPKSLSANLHFHPYPGAMQLVTFPLVQGMAFVTAIYTNATPLLQSSVFFRTVQPIPFISSESASRKYKVLLEDGKMWLLYAFPDAGNGPLELTKLSNTRLQARVQFTGIIQIAKIPRSDSSAESIYDRSAGAYATSVSLSGSVSGSLGTYSLEFIKAGSNACGALLMFALPHHVASFDSNTTRQNVIGHLHLQTTTKGVATGVLADRWTIQEEGLPIDMEFAPWNLNPDFREGVAIEKVLSDPRLVDIIGRVASEEVRQDMMAQCNLDSMYFSGKALSKFAMIVWTIHAVVRDPQLAYGGLERLKEVFAIFVENKQQFPLVYETIWKGVVSTGSYVTGNALQDFGNTYYNDHHFHYGYFIYAAAVIGHLDPAWISANKDWVNTLVRDAANPTEDDPYFPCSRAFDWYHGHSWAKGLFESADGKDEESSSEDAFFAYALKMWGKTVGDRSMEARGTLMLAVLRRSLHNYLLMDESNWNHPRNFVGNKVTGILFENKVDHTTYFGHVIEYIQGIHMIPINPSSAYIRSRTFVREEWKRYFDQERADHVAGGWRGLVYANLAILEPKASWNFFAQSGFQSDWLDGGASRTWYLVYSAVMDEHSD